MRAVRTLTRIAALALLGAPLGAQIAGVDASGQPLSLPYLDVRLAPDRPTAEVRQAVVAARDAVARAAREADGARLKAAVPGVRWGDHEFFGTPNFVRSTSHLLTGPSQHAPRAVVRDFVDAYAGLFEIDAAEVDLARVSRDFVTKHNGVTHLTFTQQVDGVDIWGAEIKASVTKDGELINVSSSMIPRPAGGFDLPAMRLSPEQALRLAAADAGVAVRHALVPATTASGANARQTWQPTSDFRSDVAITSELVNFAVNRGEIHPAWSVVVPVPGIGNTYETIVDATDGTILRRWNELHFYGGTQDTTYNVWTSDSPAPGSPGLSTPTGAQFPLVGRSLVTVTGASIADASPLGWIDDGGNETLGNNVDGHTDTNADNQPDLPRPTGSPFRVFDFAVDTNQAPSTYKNHSATQLFYLCNRHHDLMYRLGWDEAASNQQNDNFGLGGVGGDRLQADAQDGSGLNNARYLGSGSDGASARIEMFVFDGPTPDVDGALDADVVYHECTHGLSIRLSGGTVFGEQSGGMGEGWSDYVALSMNAEPGDDPNGVYPAGAWATKNLFGSFADNYYFGIRRYPYSTDMTKSPFTYADIDPAQIVVPGGIPSNGFFIGNPADEVHNVGEIWCQALLECRANLWSSLGFAGNELLLQLVVDGLKLMPSNPNMLEARDAILQADLVDYGGIHLGDLWTGFAKRGMGGSATSPAGGSSTTGIVEAFDVPALVVVTYPGGKPTQLQPSMAESFLVDIDSFGGTVVTPGTATLNVRVNGVGGFGTFAMSDLGGGSYQATIPGLSCFDSVEYYVSVGTNQGTLTDPGNAPTQTYGAEVFTGVSTVFADDFESDMGWTVGQVGDNATTGIWTRVDPVGTAAQPEDDFDASGTQCFVTGQGLVGGGLGDNDVDGGTTSLLSPTIDLSGGDARIHYARWYSNDTGGAPNEDTFLVSVSNNGGSSWTTVETVGPAGPGTSGGWIEHEFVVSDFVAPSANVRVRFQASDLGTGSLVEAGVDAFSVFRVECDATCQPDLGFSGPGDLTLSICGAPLSTGNAPELRVENATPSGNVFLVIGLANNPTPFKGGLLVPVPITLLLSAPADGAGVLAFPLPGGGGPLSVYVQAAAADGSQLLGYELSNAVEAQFLP
ncbi:MAG: M36 family metallopeptidase [Planctomycetes bacterium]|nr:M36 family metallopeptidase [Planctomycetota bacterium]